MMELVVGSIKGSLSSCAAFVNAHLWTLVVLTGTLASGAGLTMTLAGAPSRAPQGKPVLQITSPPSGVVVNPGQTLTVTVTSPAGLAFQMIAVIGPDPMGFNTLASSVPAQLSIAIPSDADCRLYTLTADGLTQSGQHVTSGSIQIDVERPDFPVSLSASDSGLALESQGEQVHLAVLADFADGSTVDVTHSTLLSYASSNPAVATVDASGTVTVVAAGNAFVTAKYTILGQSLQISIPVNVSHPKLTVSPASSSQSVGTSSQPGDRL